MNNSIFLYRDNTNDRDCCVYIEPCHFECGHYFSRLKITGACYSNSDFAEYKDIQTILTEDEYNKLLKFGNDISNLGYSIKKGDERYDKGMKLCAEIQAIFDKLQSEEAQNFFEKISNEEMEYLKKEYGFYDDDIEDILNNYSLEYKDRSIVGCVFKDAYECGYEEAFNLGIVNDDNNITTKYFDFEKFGQDLADEDERYLELSDGRIVLLNY